MSSATGGAKKNAGAVSVVTARPPAAKQPHCVPQAVQRICMDLRPFVRWWSCLVLAAILAAGILLPLIVYHGVTRTELKNLQDQLADAAGEEVVNVQDVFKRTLHAVENLRMALNLAPDGGLSYSQFAESVSLLHRPVHAAASFMWMPLVRTENRSAFESHTRSINRNVGEFANFTILDREAMQPPIALSQRFDLAAPIVTTVAGNRSMYLPMLYVLAADDIAADRSLVGVDMLLTLNIVNFTRSLVSGVPDLAMNIVATGDRLSRGLLISVPVYKGLAPTTVEERLAKATGFLCVAAGVSRLADRGRLHNTSLEIHIFDEEGLLYAAPKDAARVPSSPSDVPSVHGTRVETTITFVNKKYVFVAVPTRKLVEGATSPGPLVFALLTGAGFSILLAGAIVAIRTIVLTQQRMAASERQRRCVTEMIGFVNHELRNPLNAIMGLLDHATRVTEGIVATSSASKVTSSLTSTTVASSTATSTTVASTGAPIVAGGLSHALESGKPHSALSSTSAQRLSSRDEGDVTDTAAFVERPTALLRTSSRRSNAGSGAVATDFAEKMVTVLRDLRDTGQMCSLMKHIIDDALDIRRLEERGLKIVCAPVSLARVLEDVTAIVQPKLSEKPTLSLTVSSFDDDVVFLSDAVRVKQLLLNLVVNAIKYSENGVIKVHVEAVKSGESLRFAVQDNGKGIEDAKKQYLFHPFMQLNGSARHQGVGLGLYLCSMLVESMGGEIGFESTAGVGSTFWFELPYEAAVIVDCDGDDSWGESMSTEEGHGMGGPNQGHVAVAVPSVGETARGCAGGGLELRMISACGAAESVCLHESATGTEMQSMSLKAAAETPTDKRIHAPSAGGPSPNSKPRKSVPPRHLVCDDMGVNRVVLKRYIQSAFPDIVVDEAENGLVGVRLAQEREYDIVWMDVQMPVMDGIEATKRIRASPQCQQTTVIGITGDITPEEVARYRSAGMHDVCGKPVSRVTIVETIRKWRRRS